MGFSLTGTHVIFFVSSVIVAGAISGVFMAVSLNTSDSLSKRGDRLVEQLDTDFKIINDNENIPTTNGYYNFYLKNIGEGNLITTNETFQVFIDGDPVSSDDYNFSTSSVWSEEVNTLNIKTTEIAGSGQYVLKIVGPQAVEDKFEFNI